MLFKLFTSNASRVILKVVDFIDSVICNFTIMRIVNNVFTAFEIIQVAISDMIIDSIFQSRKRLYNRKCPSVCLSITETPQPVRIAPIDHYQSLSLSTTDLSSLLTIKPTIKPIDHQAYRLLSLLTSF